MHFEKVSYSRFAMDVNELYDKKISSDEYIMAMYNKIKLPQRSTKGSIGYDFVIPFNIDIYKGTAVVIPTGIRCVDMPYDTGLVLAPRSGLGFRYRTSLANTIGIIDPDYSESTNEGHILVKLCYDDFNYITKINDSTLINPENSVLTVETIISDSPNVTKWALHFNAGDKFCQGFFPICRFVDDDETNIKRDGGFGSTGMS